MDTTNFEDIRNEWIEQGQGHVFNWFDKLSNEEKLNFENDIRKINVKEVNKDYKNVLLDKDEQKIMKYEHFENVMTLNKIKEQDKKKWEDIGYELISKGEVAVLLLAGGQATRLGTTFPKGFYDVGLPSKKSLFQLQAERIYRLQQLVSERYNGSYDQDSKPIQWYIMTSEATHSETIKFFENKNYFGLKKSAFFFFSQAMIPCITPEDGKIISESGSKLSLSPNGNGGLFKALSTSGAIDDMRKKGIKYVTQYCVDNILINMADPVFVGYMHDQSADCGAKVVSKSDPKEPVGVMALNGDGKPFVLEYSEIDEQSKFKKDQNGQLVFNYAHICINGFSFDFLDRIAKNHLDHLKYHVAFKKIPSAHPITGERQSPSSPNGWKLEKFIFDVFPFSKKMVCLEIERSKEFSPLKNCGGMNLPDSPETCLRDISNLHKNFIENSGGKIDSSNSTICEVSPLVSLNGENLKNFVNDKTFILPIEINQNLNN
ncbi:hypothetical protein ACTFIW_008401 [Dictyostelium discoideum]